MSTPKKELTKIDLYSMGYSAEQIAKIKGMNVSEVKAWIKKSGIKPKLIGVLIH